MPTPPSRPPRTSERGLNWKQFLRKEPVEEQLRQSGVSLPSATASGDTGSVLCRHVGESGHRSQRPRAPRAGGPPVLPHLDFGLAFSELWQKGLVLFLATQACSATQWGVLGRQACSGHEATAQLPGHRVQNGAVGGMALLSGVQAVVGTPTAIHARPAARAVSTCGAAWEEGCGLRGRRAPQSRAGGARRGPPAVCRTEEVKGGQR